MTIEHFLLLHPVVQVVLILAILVAFLASLYIVWRWFIFPFTL